MSDLEDTVVKYRWDQVWNRILSSRSLTSQDVLCRLMGSVMCGYSCRKSVFTTDERWPNPEDYPAWYVDGKGHRVALMLLDVEHEEYELHFVASNERDIGMEALSLAVRNSILHDTPEKGYGEFRTVSSVHIIDLYGTMPPCVKWPVSFGFHLDFVFNLYHIGSAFTALEDVCAARSLEEAMGGAQRLYAELTKKKSPVLWECCAALADPQVWTPTGARDVAMQKILYGVTAPLSRGEMLLQFMKLGG